MFNLPEPGQKKELLPDVKHPAEWDRSDYLRAGVGLLLTIVAVWIALAIIF